MRCLKPQCLNSILKYPNTRPKVPNGEHSEDHKSINNRDFEPVQTGITFLEYINLYRIVLGTLNAMQYAEIENFFNFSSESDEHDLIAFFGSIYYQINIPILTAANERSNRL